MKCPLCNSFDIYPVTSTAHSLNMYACNKCGHYHEREYIGWIDKFNKARTANKHPDNDGYSPFFED